MEIKKYRLDPNDMKEGAFRIIALIDIAELKVGEKGGYVESENNLNHEGTCWVGGNAVVGDSAVVGGSALIQSTSDYLCVSPIGSRNAVLTCCRDKELGMRFTAGCFSGSEAEFLERVLSTHRDSRHALAYRAAVCLARIQLSKEQS